jgi:dTDP-4-dehydrorhamnose 3,5-epimerase
MDVMETALPGVLIVEPRVFRDRRGAFVESWHQDRYRSIGIDVDYAQDNVSISRRGVLRGLHFQYPSSQAKLITALDGVIFDVAVDVRSGSPSFGTWVGVELSGESFRQLFVPEGFAHGFLVLSESACVLYKCSRFYSPSDERSLHWDDPDIGIEWPDPEPILSEKDRNAPRLREFASGLLPPYDKHAG